MIMPRTSLFYSRVKCLFLLPSDSSSRRPTHQAYSRLMMNFNWQLDCEVLIMAEHSLLNTEFYVAASILKCAQPIKIQNFSPPYRFDDHNPSKLLEPVFPKRDMRVGIFYSVSVSSREQQKSVFAQTYLTDYYFKITVHQTSYPAEFEKDGKLISLLV